jgi:hypothetical protein
VFIRNLRSWMRSQHRPGRRTGNQPGNIINEFRVAACSPPTIFMPYAVHPLDEFVQSGRVSA